MKKFSQSKIGEPEYPVGTLAIYGPDNKVATKLVAAVFSRPGQREPTDWQRWITHAGDVRNDPIIGEEVAGFFKMYGVKRTVMSDRIMGCAHEEGKEYPEGGTC